MRKCGRMTVGFVPTMGALHRGHLALIKRSVSENDITVVSIFVNPKQFGPREDFSKYSRNEAADIRLASKSGADAVFIPDIKELYPRGYKTYVEVQDLDKNLCGPFRPGHFRGVATVVAKLLNIVEPDRAYFGKKDFQQFVIIKKMAEDLNMKTEIIPCPTVRDADGLALSSRNSYLTAAQRKDAGIIYKALKKTANLIKYRNLKNQNQAYEAFRNLVKKIPDSRIEYFQIVDPGELKISGSFKGRQVAACAVKVGNTRLIDNIEIN